jgi:SAM-dependent methyltransferase
VIEETDLEDGQVLVDLGCGTGLLKSYLDLIKKNIKYVGVDVVPEFIQHVQTLPEAEAANVDFYNNLQTVPDADWYAIFGSINKRWMVGLKDTDSLEPVYDWIENVFKKSHKGIYINGFTDRADKPKVENVHLSPIEIIKRLGTSCKSYRIRHDNPFYEFTLMVSK